VDFAGGARTLSASAQVNGPGSFEVDGGDLVLDGSLSDTNVNVSGGVLTIDASLAGSAMNISGGTLEIYVGATVTVGSYTQVGGVLEFDLQSDSGSLSVTGSAALAGGLSLNDLDGTTPPPGSSFDLINYATHTGAFSSVTGGYDIFYGGQGVVASVPTV